MSRRGWPQLPLIYCIIVSCIMKFCQRDAIIELKYLEGRKLVSKPLGRLPQKPYNLQFEVYTRNGQISTVKEFVECFNFEIIVALMQILVRLCFWLLVIFFDCLHKISFRWENIYVFSIMISHETIPSQSKFSFFFFALLAYEILY